MNHSLKVGALFSALLLTGCLDGGSDSTTTGSSGSSGSGSSGFTVSGVAMAGPISGRVCAYALSSAGTVGNELACAQTNATTGAYSLQIMNYVGDVLLKAWGQYVDEATGQTMTISEADALRSISRSGSSGDRTAAITPITEAVIRAAGSALTNANFDAAAAKLASALGMAAADQVLNELFKTQPEQGNTYREMLNHWSQAQKTYCTSSGAPTGCDLNAHLKRISDAINTNPNELRNEINAAMQSWQAANPTGASCQFSATGSIVCNLPGTSGGGSTPGGGTTPGGGSTPSGTYTLTVVTTASGVTTPPVVLNNMPKPASQTEFCGEVNSQTSSLSLKNQLANVGGSLTINSCSFNGTTGSVSATVTLTSPISMSVPYSVTYTYSN